jgi:hypothetical protein
MLTLALEVANLCTPTQFGQLGEELCMKNWDSEQWRLDELSFREAEFRVKNGEDTAARQLLQILKDQGLSAPLVEVLETLYQ